MYERHASPSPHLPALLSRHPFCSSRFPSLFTLAYSIGISFPLVLAINTSYTPHLCMLHYSPYSLSTFLLLILISLTASPPNPVPSTLSLVFPPATPLYIVTPSRLLYTSPCTLIMPQALFL
ncbi:hypothetical protein DFH11DRAFT_727860 [Phellopilus nigrolimitatus]|nr:hypothetical protein DFH11DRAFT_727860 [Phellopilus nigrolimitatus]